MTASSATCSVLPPPRAARGPPSPAVTVNRHGSRPAAGDASRRTRCSSSERSSRPSRRPGRRGRAPRRRGPGRRRTPGVLVKNHRFSGQVVIHARWLTVPLVRSRSAACVRSSAPRGEVEGPRACAGPAAGTDCGTPAARPRGWRAARRSGRRCRPPAASRDGAPRPGRCRSRRRTRGSRRSARRRTAMRPAAPRPQPVGDSGQMITNTEPLVTEVAVSSSPTVRGPPVAERELAKAAAAEARKAPEASSRYSCRLSDLALRSIRLPTRRGPRARPESDGEQVLEVPERTDERRSTAP